METKKQKTVKSKEVKITASNNRLSNIDPKTAFPKKRKIAIDFISKNGLPKN